MSADTKHQVLICCESRDARVKRMMLEGLLLARCLEREKLCTQGSALVPGHSEPERCRNLSDGVAKILYCQAFAKGVLCCAQHSIGGSV